LNHHPRSIADNLDHCASLGESASQIENMDAGKPDILSDRFCFSSHTTGAIRAGERVP
jgi:hypothetical protein